MTKDKDRRVLFCFSIWIHRVQNLCLCAFVIVYTSPKWYIFLLHFCVFFVCPKSLRTLKGTFAGCLWILIQELDEILPNVCSPFTLALLVFSSFRSVFFLQILFVFHVFSFLLISLVGHILGEKCRLSGFKCAMWPSVGCFFIGRPWNPLANQKRNNLRVFFLVCQSCQGSFFFRNRQSYGQMVFTVCSWE